MKIFIHRRGAGPRANAIELASGGKRLLIDLGFPMDTEASVDAWYQAQSFPVRGLLATILAEPEQDHACYTRISRPVSPVVLDAQAGQALQAAHLFTATEKPVLDHRIRLEHGIKTVIGPFSVTPYRTSGGLLNSYALEVMADDQRLLYTGALFNYDVHGEIWQHLRNGIQGAYDAILVHGFSSCGLANNICTHDEAADQFTQLIASTQGVALAWVSGQHLERVADLVVACRRTRRRLVMDLYTAELLRAAGADFVPQGDSNGIYVFLPEFQRRHIRRDAMFHSLLRYPEARLFPDQLKAAPSQYTLLFRPSLMEDLERMGCLYGARMIYCLWHSYLEQPRLADFRKWCSRHGISVVEPEAPPNDRYRRLPQLLHRLWSDTIIPINPEEYSALKVWFTQVETRPEGVWWEIGTDQTWDYESIDRAFED